MSTLLTNTAAAFFGEFREEIIYRKPGEDDRAILAQVVRERPATISEANRVTTMVTQIAVKNLAQSKEDDADGIGGISSEELDTGRDKLVYDVRVGLDPVPRSIKQIVSQDEAIIVLEVR